MYPTQQEILTRLRTLQNTWDTLQEQKAHHQLETKKIELKQTGIKMEIDILHNIEDLMEEMKRQEED